ncbi:hypothetical protein [Azospirillum palustre]
MERHATVSAPPLPGNRISVGGCPRPVCSGHATSSALNFAIVASTRWR